MKKLFILLIIGWMSMVNEVLGQEKIFINAGWCFGSNSARAKVSVDFCQNYGLVGAGLMIPSGINKTLTAETHVGATIAIGRFMRVSPRAIFAYEYGTVDKTSYFATGIGIDVLIQIIQNLGVNFGYTYSIRPFCPEPLNGVSEGYLGATLIIHH